MRQLDRNKNIYKIVYNSIFGITNNGRKNNLTDEDKTKMINRIMDEGLIENNLDKEFLYELFGKSFINDFFIKKNIELL